MKKMKFYLMALVAVAMMAVSCDGKGPAKVNESPKCPCYIKCHR